MRLPRNVWVLTLTSFLTDVSSEMLTAILPLYLSNVLGARTAVIGLIEGTAETTASAVKIVSGHLSDRLGRRKGLTVAGYALSTAVKPLLLFASSWFSILGVRFLDRVGKGIRTAPRDALLADSTSSSQRGLAFGIHRAGDTAGALVGMLVALAVVWASDRHALVISHPLFQTLVLLCIVPAILAVAALACFARETKSKSPPNSLQKLSLRPFDARFKKFLLITVVFTLGNSSDAFLILRAQQAGLSVAGILGMMICFNIVYTVAAGPAGALSDRVGRRRVIIAGWLGYAFIYLGFAFADTGPQIWLLMTLYGLYYAATEGAAKAFVADLVPSSLRGTAYGVYNAAVGIAALPASLCAGILWQGVGSWHGLGPSAPFLLSAILALYACALLAFLVPPQPRPGTNAPHHLTFQAPPQDQPEA